MARLIKPDGSEQTVTPANGIEFTNDELHNYIDGNLTGVTLTYDEEGLYMFMDDEYVFKNKPVNQVATDIVHKYRSNLQHITIGGTVVIVDAKESGS